MDELFPVESMIHQANLLPRDGVVQYLGRVWKEVEAREWMEVLMKEVPWRRDEVVMFGKRVVTAREVAWYGDAGCDYRYSGVTKRALPWTESLLKIKRCVEEWSGEKFNACLLNFYHDGGEGMGWHSDDEKDLVRDAAIASVSLGAERRFCFKHKESGEKVELSLGNGSLLVMKGATQRFWLHRLPPTKRVTEPRINLTFRRMKLA